MFTFAKHFKPYKENLFRLQQLQPRPIMSKKIKLAVFDIAGTTMKDDSNVASAFQQAFLQHGFGTVSLAEANEKMGYPKPLAIKEILSQHVAEIDQVTEALVGEIHDDFVGNMIQYYKVAPGIAPMDDAERVLGALQQMGIKVGLDTGFSRDITDVILERVGWKNSPLIDITVASDEVERGRPYPDMIRKMMAELGIDDAAEVIKIGDTEVDVNEGHNAGCAMSVAVTTGAYSEAELLKHNPSHLIHSLSDLIPLVKNHLGQI